MYGCESWTIKKAEHQRIDAFELCCWRRESPLDCKKIKPIHPKGNQSSIFTGRSDAEAKTPILWPLDATNWLTGKDPDSGKDWRWEERGRDEMGGWHHPLSLSRLWELVMDREAWCAAGTGIGKSQTRQSDWTDFLLLTKSGHWMDLLLTYHTWVAYEPSLFFSFSLCVGEVMRDSVCALVAVVLTEELKLLNRAALICEVSWSSRD